MTRGRADLRLMLVTDATMISARDLAETVLAAVAGGVTIVQLRDKTRPDEALIATARALKSRLAPLGIPLVVNDRVDVAQAAAADGVHLGQSDGDPAEARARLGAGALIGLSVTDAAQLPGVDPTVVDYVGLGPVFTTATKPDADPPIGLDGVRAICRRLAVPVVAIGGIDAGNAGAVAAAGADGIAVVSAICAAPDPAVAAAALRRALAEGGRP
jgi:thiamine-phosphate pyrophosphorylase